MVYAIAADMRWNMDALRLVKGIRAGIGFLTTIPVRGDESGFDIFTGHVYIFIIVGAIIGAMLGMAGIVLHWLLPPAFVPVLLVAFTYLLTGINHLDGLADFGDGLVASGTREKKIAAMKDVHAGAGGILFIGMGLLFLYAAFSLFAGLGWQYILVGLLVAEVCARICLTTAAAFGKSLHPGMGSMFIDKTRKDHYLIGLAMALVICMTAMGLLPWFRPNFYLYALAGFLTVSVVVALGLFIVDVADRNFGGVNGDVLGAANEIGRIAALLVLGMLTWTLW